MPGTPNAEDIVAPDCLIATRGSHGECFT